MLTQLDCHLIGLSNVFIDQLFVTTLLKDYDD
jgi:hypothetical protein